MLILALGFWVASVVLVLVIFLACAWCEQRNPHALDRVLSPIQDESLDDELARWRT